MPRINLTEKLKDLEEDLPPLNKIHNKKRFIKVGRLKRSCFIIALAVFLIFLFLALTALAKTGIWQIPLVSKVFYHLPEPTRTVVIDNPGEYVTRIPSIAYDEAAKSLKIELTEEEATFMIRRNVAKQDRPKFAQNIQAVFTDDQVEFFGLMLYPIKTNITLALRLNYNKEANQLASEITKFKIGNLNLPPALVNWLVSTYGQFKLNKEFKDLGIDLNKIDLNNLKMKLKNFQISEGKIAIEIYLDLAGMSQNFNEVMNKLNSNNQVLESITTP